MYVQSRDHQRSSTCTQVASVRLRVDARSAQQIYTGRCNSPKTLITKIVVFIPVGVATHHKGGTVAVYLLVDPHNYKGMLMNENRK